MGKKLFVTATGTDIGKTYVSALIIKKLKENGFDSGYYKAAVSGNQRDEKGNIIAGDPQYVKDIAQLNENIKNMVSYIYEMAVSPHLAGSLESNLLEKEKVLKDFQMNFEKYDYLLMEGSGGIICPLRYDNKRIFLEDIIRILEIPCIIVANCALGTINSTLLTISYMQSKNIEIKGLIFNNYNPQSTMERDNIKVIQEVSGVEVLDCIKTGDKDLNIDITKLTNIYK